MASQPRDLMREAVDRIIKDGTKEERTGALHYYEVEVNVRHQPVVAAYQPLVLDFLTKDDMLEKGYTLAVVGTLGRFYPSRESFFAIMEAAKRAPNRDVRFEVLSYVAGVICRIDIIDARWAPEGPLIDKKMADFEAWVERNRERIRFTKEGDFKLTGGKVSARQPKLGREDRGRIRRDPGCVLRLMSALSESGESNLDAKGLTVKCGEALFGVEGARAMQQAWEESSRAEGPSLEAQTRLSSLAGQYPYADAWLLAAAYVAAYETDPKAVALAKEALIQVSPSEIKRITQGEPRPVVRKARDLANPGRAAPVD
ncbi:MAG TPA: hypothetical protein VGR67_08110 [Candidatus Polarisedimenticolia bacterium]|nr:hypothetical protein [Candidatus Polarisedimenticolia bacterium]